jgi:sortase B
MDSFKNDDQFDDKLIAAIELANSIVRENNAESEPTGKTEGKAESESTGRAESESENSVEGNFRIEEKNNHDTQTSTQVSNAKKKLNKIPWLIVAILSLAALVVCTVLVVNSIISGRKSRKQAEKLREYVNYVAETTENNTTESTENTGIGITVDFEGLKAENPDVCAWVYIPGTDINYPVLQGEDNSYYLSHDAYGEASGDGAIFVDSENAKDFTDFDTIVYGHNMYSGTMFKTLHQFENEEFWNYNRTVYILMPDKVNIYTVFAAYRTDDRHILSYNDFSKVENRQAYLKNIFDEKFDTGIVKNDMEVGEESNILTLSTCCGMTGKRWMVQAVLTEVR